MASRAVALGVLLAVTVAARVLASAGGPVVTSIQDAAGESPFAGLSCNVTSNIMIGGGHYVEPFIAVNPRDPNNRIVAWIDRTRNADDTAYTTNGGRTWHTAIPMGLDGCTGNSALAFEGNGDPGLSFGPDGTAYFESEPWQHWLTPPQADYIVYLYVQRSDNAGRTWQAPVHVDNGDMTTDKPFVIADPNRAGVVYVVWRNTGAGVNPQPPSRGRSLILFSRSVNGGQSFSPPQIVDDNFPANASIGPSELAVLRNDTLVYTYGVPDPQNANVTDMVAKSSRDQGRTWSQRVLIRRVDAGDGPTVCHGLVFAGAYGNPGGNTVIDGRTVAILSQNNTGAVNGPASLTLSESSDGGATWTSRTVVRSNLPLLLSNVAAGSHGALGIEYDQLNPSAVNCGSLTIPARSIVEVSTDNGVHWRQTTVGARWWNFGDATSNYFGSNNTGFWLGDYQWLAPTPTGFTTAMVQGHALAGRGPSIVGATGVDVANIAVHR